MAGSRNTSQFALCVRNEGCDDPETRKIYQVLQDDDAAKEGYIRVVDESGPDHVKTFLVEVELGGQVVGIGRGRTKKEAEQCAAAQALENPKSGLSERGDA